MSHARTIRPEEMTNLMTSLHSGNVLVDFFINATHPYERIGKYVLRHIYEHGSYRINYGKKPGQDRVCVFHTVGDGS